MTELLSFICPQDGVSVFGGAIGAMHIPEKWFPGSLDYYLNSHNIMHILVVVAVYSMHQVRPIDAIHFTHKRLHILLFGCF